MTDKVDTTARDFLTVNETAGDTPSWHEDRVSIGLRAEGASQESGRTMAHFSRRP